MWDWDALRKPCLVVIDAQEKYNHAAITTLPDVTERIARLIRAAGARGWPVYWTAYCTPTRTGSIRISSNGLSEGQEYGFDDSDSRVAERLRPHKFGKTRKNLYKTRHFSAFSNEALRTALCEHDSVVLCGGWTQFCVLMTACEAFSRDILVCVVSDACFTLRRMGQGHGEALRTVGHIARVATTREVEACHAT